jgi:hypothetical protein
MANSKISALTSATTPLAGTETLPIVQSSTTKQVSVANLTVGRAVAMASSSTTGNAGVGTASPDVFSRGYTRILGVDSTGTVAIEINAATGNAAYFDMGVANSRAVNVYADSTSGAIATVGSKVFSIGTNSTPAIVIDTSQNVFPNTDNAKTLGASGNRWSVVYAGTGTINTSDARQKTQVTSLTDAELAASKDLASEIGTFQFLSAIKQKGDLARLHIGMTVQRAIEIMQSHGLDPLRYGFICHDQWDKNEVTFNEITNENGDVIEPKQMFVTEAGEQYGFRTDELMLFIARGFDARLKALELK